MKNKTDHLDELIMRSARAGVYAIAAYIMFWLQSVYDGSYLLGSLIIFLFGMTRQSLILTQVMLGTLFILTVLSDEITKAAAALT
jgi:hypothetical protein